MAAGLCDQFENHITLQMSKRGVSNKSHRYEKQLKHRKERRRVRQNPNCHSEYKRFKGFEW